MSRPDLGPFVCDTHGDTPGDASGHAMTRCVPREWLQCLQRKTLRDHAHKLHSAA